MFWNGGSVTMLHKLKHENGDIAAVVDCDLQFMLDRGYVYMTDGEINKHESVPESEFHTEWDGKTWIDVRTSEERLEYARSQMPTLSPSEFDIKLVDAGLYNQVQDLIQLDIKLKIAYTRALFFSRTDPFIEQARIALELTNEQVDAIWIS